MSLAQILQVDAAHLCSHCPAAVRRKPEDSTASEVVFRLTYNRERPTTTWQKLAFECSNCCLCFYTFCCPPCPPCIIRKMAFAPPDPTYEFTAVGPRKNGEYRIRLSRDAKRYSDIFYPVQVFHSLMRGFYVESGSRRRRIACLYCRSSWFDQKARKTFLLSHSNAEDLGLMVGRITMISTRLEVDVLAYDYTGYGRSDGWYSERHLYEDIKYIYEFMIYRMRIPWRQIVAVGTSLGSAPTIHLASRYRVCAVVLQGSFASALRTMCPGRKDASCIDQFVNVDKIVGVTCPTLFVHGDQDKMFPLVHVQQLLARCPGARNVEPLIIRGGDHVDFDRFEEYWQSLHQFIADLEMLPRDCSDRQPVQKQPRNAVTEATSLLT